MKISTGTIVRVGILAALSVPIMLFNFPLPIFPNFLKLDFSDVPCMIAALTAGPTAGFFTVLIKIIVENFVEPSSTGGIGEIANLFISSAYVIPLGMVYHSARQNGERQSDVYQNENGVNDARLLVAAMVATVCSVIAAGALNYIMLIPWYGYFYGIGEEGVIGMSSAVIPAIKDKITLTLYAVVPFNLLKGVIMSIVGVSVFRLLGRFLITKQA
ncbi:MAG: ECF transporter S component [Clostridiales bacterium]|jgi:riboflavin transporter FmnP|nr:ECF transporter S component [Clostridiales bacterium]